MCVCVCAAAADIYVVMSVLTPLGVDLGPMVLALHSQTPFPCMCDLFLQVPLRRPCTRDLTGQALVAQAHVDLAHVV